MAELLDDCARELMETSPLILQSIRTEMRKSRGADLSIPHFRSMRFIQRNPQTSLTDLADFIGLTLPSASKLVDGLVKKKLVTRQESSQDRRRIILKLTSQGEGIVNTARAETLARMKDQLNPLDDGELEIVRSAFQILHQIFRPSN